MLLSFVAAALLAVALLAPGGVSPEGVSAAQNIDPSSCGGAGFPNCSGLPANVTIGANSCMGFDSCDSLGDGVVIGNDSCNATSACENAGFNAGSAEIGDGSCNASFACDLAGANGGSAQIGDYSCNATLACHGSGSGTAASIGNYSCNQDNQFDANCNGSHPDVGICEFNDDDKIPEVCLVMPTLEFTFVQHTDKGDKPYTPGTWARWSVTVTITCLPDESGTPIALNSYPETLNFNNDGIYDLGAVLADMKCKDQSGTEAPGPDPWPIIKVDRHRPTCDATPLLQYVPENDPADSGKRYGRSFQVVAQDGTLTGETVLTIVLRSVQASGGTTSGLDIGTFDTSGRFEGRPDATYVLTWRVTDEAGRSGTCSAKVQTARN